MGNASFIASLASDLRQEILLTSDEAFLTSVPPNIIAEAEILRERVSTQQRRPNNDTAVLWRSLKDLEAGAPMRMQGM